jgi:hypothetical protein
MTPASVDPTAPITAGQYVQHYCAFGVRFLAPSNTGTLLTHGPAKKGAVSGALFDMSHPLANATRPIFGLD